MGESAATEQAETIHVDAANTWQKVYWDLSDITGTSRDAITKLRITLPNVNQTVYVDNIRAEKSLLTTPGGSSVTSTVNKYFQYRVILSTTNANYVPTFSKALFTYSTAAGSQTIDADSVNLVNDPTAHTSARLSLTTTTLDDLKSYNTTTNLTGVTQTGDFDPGTGADGDIIIASDTNINVNNRISGRSCTDGGDAVNYSVTNLSSTTATLTSSPSNTCLAPGDEVLLINLQGSSTAYANVGNYETLRVANVSGNTVTFTNPKTKFYGVYPDSDAGLDTTEGSQRVMLQRVPNYHNVTVQVGASLYPSDWDGVKNGVMFFRASGSVTANGTITAAGKGYRTGNYGTSENAYAGGGEAFCDFYGGAQGADGGTSTPNDAATPLCGGGGGAVDGYSRSLGTATGGAGGGGGSRDGDGTTSTYGGGGGGGGYGTPGKKGLSQTSISYGTDGGDNISGDGGVYSSSYYSAGGGGGGSYGTPDLSKLLFGSAGGVGGAGHSGVSNSDGSPNPGGDGGGIVVIAADTVNVSGALDANGGDGVVSTTYRGGGGGGAGGSLKILGRVINLGTNVTQVTGGLGGNDGLANDQYGGDGGDGRLAIYYADTYTGTTPQTAYTAAVPAYAYSIFTSDEIPTPDATQLTRFSWLADLNTYGHIQFQTRTGATSNASDGTWEAWKPSTSAEAKLIDAGNKLTMNTHTDWVSGSAPNDITVADGGVTRNVDYYEDEDESTVGNMTKLSSVGSSTGYAEASITALDTSAYDYLSAWVYATSSGNVVTFGIGESAGNEHQKTLSINATNTWQKIFWDLKDIPVDQRDALTKVRITIPSTNDTVYVDNISFNRFMADSAGSAIASTPNNYIQYRAILTTTNAAYHPTLHNVNFGYSDGYSVEQVDTNNVRLYNYSGQTQTLRLDVVTDSGSDGSSNTFENGLSVVGDVVTLGGSLTKDTVIDQGNFDFSFNLTGTGNFDIQKNGTSVFFVDSSSGNVGIGTTDPASFKLEVGGSVGPSADNTYDLGSTTRRFKDLYLGGSTLHIGSSTTDEATFSYDTTNNILGISTDSTTNGDIAFFNDDLYLDKSTGRVGIGTTNPQSGIHMNDSNNAIQITNSTTGSSTWAEGVRIALMNSKDLRLNAYETGGNIELFSDSTGSVILGDAGTSDLTVVNSNVGIGTTDPLAKLHVNGDLALENADGQISHIFTNGYGVEDGWIEFNAGGTNGITTAVRDLYNQVFYTGITNGVSGTDYNFVVGQSMGVDTDTLVVNAVSHAVGIGTTAPLLISH